MRHDIREVRQFLIRHSLKVNGHQHSRHLIIRNLVLHVSLNHIGDFFSRKRFVIPLFTIKSYIRIIKALSFYHYRDNRQKGKGFFHYIFIADFFLKTAAAEVLSAYIPHIPSRTWPG